MPMYYQPPTVTGKGKRVEFWIQSSRGTDEKEIVTVPAEWTNEDIKYEVENWCQQFGAWHVSENVVHYGHRPAPRPRKTAAKKKGKKR